MEEKKRGKPVEEKNGGRRKLMEEKRIGWVLKNTGARISSLKKFLIKMARAPKTTTVDNYTLGPFWSPLDLRPFFQ